MIFIIRVCKTTDTNMGYRFCSVQSYFNTSLLSEVVIYFHVQNTQLKERRIFTQNVFSVSRTNWR